MLLLKIQRCFQSVFHLCQKISGKGTNLFRQLGPVKSGYLMTNGNPRLGK